MPKKKRVSVFELEQKETVLQFSDGTERVVTHMDGKYFYCGDAKFRISRKDIKSYKRTAKKPEEERTTDKEQAVNEE